MTFATAGIVCKLNRLAFLSKSNKSILAEVLGRKLDVDSVKQKNSRWRSVSVDP